MAMRITINGQAREIADATTLQSLLAELGLAEKPVVVEMNRVAIFPRDVPMTVIPPDAVIEIVVLAAGG
jgi:sulfur carrier protein